ncbi:MAG TPA: prepilin-type N-terminal cleavage/methylation domain-containing protein, partial [Planctomycetota bacterium]|nr:prepilin-type N-terminal cleavage/methylation domain-containing protein [Planctomycetota bacterium]
MLSHSRRRGFTLIEMSISLALGMLIITVAFAGFRTASQTVTMANRLSLQNAMLRTAVMAANEEMDTWESFDSRSDTTKQILRGATYPFAEMDFRAADTVLDFNPANGRLWWNGMLWSSNRLNDGTNYQRRFGDYSLFGRQGMTLADFALPDYPNLATERGWRHNILPYISNGMGYYAAFDYLPANFVYGYYDDNQPAQPGGSIGDIPIEFGVPGVGPGRFRPNWHSGNKPLQKVEAGHDNGYILTNTVNVPGYPNTHPNSHRASYNDNGGTWTDTLYPDRWNAFPNVDFTTVLPEMWPTVKMQVKATYSWMDFRHQVRIEQTDPYTGLTTAMVLYGITTTLREAR